MSHENLEILKTMVRAYFSERENLPTFAEIRQVISKIRNSSLCEGVTDMEAEQFAREYEEQCGVWMELGSVLTGENYKPWLDSKKIQIEPYFWSRYRELLVSNKGFGKEVISAIDEVTDRIVGLLEDPDKEGSWDRRGLVVGHIQSGKTSNYTAMICKAADAGYRLIVVIAGIHNNLRNQTQRRIDEGFVGRDSAQSPSTQNKKLFGVSKFSNSQTPTTFTTSIKDFNKNTASVLGVPLKDLKQPVILVIKKNTNTLKNLLEWLQQHNAKNQLSRIEEPMLLIDDEADNASINIKGPEAVSRINEQIRQLLKMFNRSCYVGYTATPFANIFIDPATKDEMLGQDLFPKDFIVSLDPPTNYFGPNKLFYENDFNAIRHINDYQKVLPIKHPIEWKIQELPKSLKKAVRTFIVARAIRILRGDKNKHCSMFVNASRFTDVQKQLRNEIKEFVETIENSIVINGDLPNSQSLEDDNIKYLYKTYKSEFEKKCGFSWEEIQPKLRMSVAPIKVIEVNSKSSQPLAYTEYETEGLSVIAVGGYSLSRGLTLEGLMISYFLRNSRMYDTLMQMGRWFGYRQGYDDLCRIWMTEESENWYIHISESIEELRDELRVMETAGATPEQFGLKVRSHPDSLIVTARNKLGTSEQLLHAVGLANRFVETSILRNDKLSLSSNRRTAIRFVESLRKENIFPEEGIRHQNGYLVGNVPAKIIVSFIREFQHHSGSNLTDPGPICKYIEERVKDNLENWDVLFACVQDSGPTGLVDTSLGFDLHCQRRRAGKRVDKNTLLISDKQRVSSRGVEKAGLNDEEVEQAKNKFVGKNIPDRIYRGLRKKPLFILHMLAIGENNEDLSKKKPVVAWSISFPTANNGESTVVYLVNQTWLEKNYKYELEEDGISGDEF